MHADNSFTIPAQSEVVVVGRLSSMPKGVNTSASEIYGLVTPKSDLPHRYSVFGASELVKVSNDATIPVRMVNPSAQPVKIFRRTKLADFERVDNDLLASIPLLRMLNIILQMIGNSQTIIQSFLICRIVF